MRKLALILWASLLSLPTTSIVAKSQPINKLCYINSNGGCTTASSANPFPVTGTFSGSVTVVFPTVGSAVPATAIYNAINVAGTLRGVTGLSLGSTFSQTVAIVDASGNQITSFGSSASVGATGAAVPASANYSGLNVGGTLRGATALGLGSTFSQTVAIVDASGVQITSFGGGGGAVTIADGADVTQGAIADPAYTSGSGTVISILKGMYASINGAIPLVTAPLNAATAEATKSLMIGAQYLSSDPTYTNTQQGALLVDVNGNLKVNVASATGVAQGSTTSGESGSLIMGAVTTAAPIYTTAQTSPLSLDTAGALRITGAITIAANSAVNVAQINGVTPLMGNGATGTGSPRATISNDNTAIANWGQGAIGATAPTGASQSGCVAQNAEATALTNGQMGGVACDLTKKQIIIPFANPENWVQGTTSAMTGTTSTSLIASAGGSLRNYVWVTCVNSHATVGTFVTIQDGSGGTALATVAAAANYGGQIDATPIPIKSTAATGIFVANVTTGANVICSARGYKGL